jgi:hypothetical protein
MGKMTKEEKEGFLEAMGVVIEAFDLIDQQVKVHFEKKRSGINHRMPKRMQGRFHQECMCSGERKIQRRIKSECHEARSA